LKNLEILLLTLLVSNLWGLDYPKIQYFSAVRDPVFQQYLQETQAYNSSHARGREAPPVLLFSFLVPAGMDLLSVSARFNHRYDTLASLNQIDRSVESLEGKTLLIPTQPGLFLYKESAGRLQEFIRQSRIQADTMKEIKVYYSGRLRDVLFLPEERLNAVERAYFLGILRNSPLEGLIRPVDSRRSHVSSTYGMRPDPFTGHRVFHNGVDLAAPLGTPVRAASGGNVVFSGILGDYGNLVILQHENGYQTYYGHLKTIKVHLNQRLPSGYLLGEVGTTGRSTGPHLHFEVRKNGVTEDPIPYWSP